MKNLYAKSIKANGEIEVEVFDNISQTIVTVPKEKVEALFGNVKIDFQEAFKNINKALKSEESKSAIFELMA